MSDERMRTLKTNQGGQTMTEATKIKRSLTTKPDVLVPRLRELSHAVTLGAAGRHEFTMRIPAEPDRDADIVLMAAAQEIESLRQQVEAKWISVDEAEPHDHMMIVDLCLDTDDLGEEGEYVRWRGWWDAEHLRFVDQNKSSQDEDAFLDGVAYWKPADAAPLPSQPTQEDK